MLHTICQQIWKTQQWPQDWRRSVFIPVPEKGKAKECSSYGTSVRISHATKVRFKTLLPRLQPYVNWEFPHLQAAFRKGRGIQAQIANIHYVIEEAREFQENIYFCFIDHTKAFDRVDYNKLWKILQELRIADCLTCLLRNLYTGSEATVRTKHGIMDLFQLGKEYIRTVYCHPVYLNYMQSTSCKVPGGINQKLESRSLEEISITSDMQMTPPLWQKVKKN